jgi:hypothetical protein
VNFYSYFPYLLTFKGEILYGNYHVTPLTVCEFMKIGAVKSHDALKDVKDFTHIFFIFV